MVDSRHWLRARELVEQALEQAPDRRREFVERAAGEDAELAAAALALLEQAEDDAPWPRPPEITPPEPEEPVPEHVGDWRLAERIGAGGMGTVHRATRIRGEVEQRAAIKLLRRGLDTDELLGRFRREGRLLARLDHPGIARLIESGATDDGRPYLAMEYVEGDHVHRWCDARGLGVPQRLELFREVCGAVQYAHASLVVHRDLKPSNILVGEDGRPRLLDFGIAKVLGDDEAGEREELTTRSRAVPLTPEYASPEQVRGEPVTTASDVYSLGAVLYQLLTGKRAHRFTTRTPQEVERTVCDEPPTPPSAAVLMAPEEAESAGTDPATTAQARGTSPRALARSLSGDLDRIVMKALHKQPERRYTSVEQLAEDLRRFLSGLPVLARPDSLGYRAGRFVSRNRLAVGGALALLAVVLFAWWNSDRLYRHALDAREAERQQRELAEGRLEETERAQLAEARQRGLAEQRFEDVRSLATDVILELADDLRDYPGSLELRARILGEATLRLDALAVDAGGDPALLLDLADAYINLGALQSGTQSRSLGQLDEALETLGKLDRTLAQLAEADPDRELDGLWGRRDWLEAKLQRQSGNLERALELLDRAAAVARGHRLVRVRNDQADWLVEAGRYNEALDRIEGTEALLREGHGELSDAEAREPLAQCLLLRGTVLRNLQRFGPAEASLREGRALFVELCESDPTNRALRMVLAGLDVRLGLLLTQTGRRGAESDELLQSAVASLEELCAHDERWLEPRDQLANALFNLGEHAILLGDYEAALAYHEQSEAAWLESLALAPGDVAERGLAAARDRAGLALNHLGRFEESLEFLLEARRYFKQRAAASGSALDRRDLAVNCYLTGATYRVWAGANPRPEGYVEHLEQAFEYWSESVELLAGLDADGQLMARDRAELEHQVGELEAIEALLAEAGEPLGGG